MDGNTGLIYAQQRYFDPEVGRFLSVDPVGVSAATGANFNRYWYANNNPYRFVDPDGRCAGSRLADRSGVCDFGGGHAAGAGGVMFDRKSDIPVDHESDPSNQGQPSGPAADEGATTDEGPADDPNGVYTDDGAVEPVYPIENIALIGASGIRAILSLPSIVRSIIAARAATRATAHGAERLARSGFTDDLVKLTKSEGQIFRQADGASVFLRESSPGRFDFIIEGKMGVITAHRNWSRKAIDRIAKNYGWSQ